MRFENGWVKNYRLRYDHWLEADMLARAVLDTLVRWACYEDSPPNAKIILKRGQCVTSSYELAGAFKLGRMRIRRVLELLQERSVISLHSNLRGTIITICNYDKYQSPEKEATYTATTKQPTSNLPATYEQPITKELKNNKKERIKELIHSEAAPSPTREFISRYCEVYKAKYTTNPVIDGRASGVAKRVVDQLGPGKSIALVEKYLQMNDQWFITKSHDLITFEGNLNKVELFKETGLQVTKNQAIGAEVVDSNRRVMDEYMKKKGII